MSLPICTYGNPILREKAVEVMGVSPDIQDLIKEMIETMYAEKGVGLAAEQVGRKERLFIIDIPEDMDVDDDGKRENPGVKMPLICINSRITGHSDTVQVGAEGCLSFPDIYANVDRWYEVDASYIDKDGLPCTVHAKGLLARAIQHESDHLDGILFVDHVSAVKKVTLQSKLKRLAKKTKQAL